jgi:hypothetical protein
MSDRIAEQWLLDVGAADVATLNIPPALAKGRRFDIDVRFEVDCPTAVAATTPPWHGLTVEVNGRREWQRRIATSNPGHTDSLDYHFRVEAPAGAGMRVRAVTAVKGARRKRLVIEAVESW